MVIWVVMEREQTIGQTRVVSVHKNENAAFEAANEVSKENNTHTWHDGPFIVHE